MKDSYLTILKPSEGLYKEKGSKFISLAYPVSSEEEIKEIIKNLKKEYHSARHYCYAWVIEDDAPRFRMNDDGEPSGTAGKPILGQINSKSLTNVLIIVIRYFGGILLGTGGLTHAYKAAAADSLHNAQIIERYLYDTFSINFDYHNLNHIIRTVEDFKGEIFDHEYAMECNLKVKIRKSLSAGFLESLENVKAERYLVSKIHE